VEVVLGTDGGGLVVGRRWICGLYHTAAFPGLLTLHFGSERCPSPSIQVESLIVSAIVALLSPSVTVLLLSVSTHDTF
jgi:hypothetical protein